MNLLLKPIPYFEATPFGVKSHLGVSKKFSFYLITLYFIEESLKGLPCARLYLPNFYHVRC